MIKDKNISHPYGYIYLIKNKLNGKVYIGKVEFPRTIHRRWLEHLSRARNSKKKQESKPSKRNYGSYIHYAIKKYGVDAWIIKKLDTAYKSKELKQKEEDWIEFYDSTNKKKGYNLSKRGDGGGITESIRRKISQTVTETWQDPQRRSIQQQKLKEKWLEEEYKKKALAGLKKIYGTKEFKEKSKNTLAKLKKDSEFQRRWLKSKRKEIFEVLDFLNDIKHQKPLSYFENKFKMDHKTIYKRIEEFLGSEINNITKARAFLKDKDISLLI